MDIYGDIVAIRQGSSELVDELVSEKSATNYYEPTIRYRLHRLGQIESIDTERDWPDVRAHALQWLCWLECVREDRQKTCKRVRILGCSDKQPRRCEMLGSQPVGWQTDCTDWLRSQRPSDRTCSTAQREKDVLSRARVRTAVNSLRSTACCKRGSPDAPQSRPELKNISSLSVVCRIE